MPQAPPRRNRNTRFSLHHLVVLPAAAYWQMERRGHPRQSRSRIKSADRLGARLREGRGPDGHLGYTGMLSFGQAEAVSLSFTCREPERGRWLRRSSRLFWIVTQRLLNVPS